MGSALNSEGRIANMLVRSLDRSPGSENKKQSKPTLKKTFRTPIALPVEVVVVVVAGGGGAACFIQRIRIAQRSFRPRLPKIKIK